MKRSVPLIAGMLLCLGMPATAASKPPTKSGRTKTRSAVGPGPASKGPVVTKVPRRNQAYLFATGGAIDTEIELDDFVHEDHTVSVWTMLQYPHSTVGPVVAEKGSGVYMIGQGDYRDGDFVIKRGEPGVPGDPVVFVQAGNTRANYRVPEAEGGQWIHIGVVRRSGTFEVYINGKRRDPYNKDGPASDVSVSANYANKPHGTLRLGRRTPGPNKSNDWQTYGFIDDLAVFRRALSPSEVVSLASSHRLTGKEKGLWKGISFDEPEGPYPLPSVLATPYTAGVKTHRYKVSAARKSSDSAIWENVFHLISMYPDPVQLPFAKGEAWEVTQGMDDSKNSHNGYAAFSIDFKRVKADGGCAHGPVKAVAPGRVIRYTHYDDPPPKGKQEGNTVHVEHGPKFGVTYMHFEYGELADFISGGTYEAKNKVWWFTPSTAPVVDAGDELGKNGDNACHLHIGAWRTGPKGKKLNTFPQPYSDFEYSTDKGKTWRPMVRGVPRKGMWVRRMKDVKFPKNIGNMWVEQGPAVKKPAVKRPSVKRPSVKRPAVKGPAVKRRRRR